LKHNGLSAKSVHTAVKVPKNKTQIFVEKVLNGAIPLHQLAILNNAIRDGCALLAQW
jgi:hypothetical protein